MQAAAACALSTVGQAVLMNRAHANASTQRSSREGLSRDAAGCRGRAGCVDIVETISGRAGRDRSGAYQALESESSARNGTQ